jgi:hypothetical protein
MYGPSQMNSEEDDDELLSLAAYLSGAGNSEDDSLSELVDDFFKGQF